MQVIGVNVMDRKSPESLKEFLRNRPSPLTYAMAVDVDGKKTRDKWLSPMGVNGIPHAFAVKNGKLIWRGHPGKLSEEMMRAMLKPDFSAASLPGDNPGANAVHGSSTARFLRERESLPGREERGKLRSF